MEFESILVSKALPDGTFSQKAVIDTHRTITSSNDLRDFTAGTIRSSRGEFDACVYTRESVCREAASFKRTSRKIGATTKAGNVRLPPNVRFLSGLPR